MTDFSLSNCGSIWLLTPHTEEAEQWADDHLPDDRPMLGRSTAIEPRYVADIAAGIRADGLTLNS